MPYKEAAFTDFANFKNDDSNEVRLPFVNPLNEKPTEVNLAHGSYSTTLELSPQKALKITRMLRVSSDGVFFQANGMGEYLTPKTGDSAEAKELDRASMIERLSKFAVEKQEAYDILHAYLGDLVPKLDGFIIAESPRKVIEDSLLDSRKMKLPTEILESIPTSEVALMEVWENIGSRVDVSGKPLESIKNIYEDASFKEQTQRLSQAAIRLLLDKGMMLDICDYDGVRGREENDEKVLIESFKDTVSVLKEEGHITVVPRNLSYSNGKLFYYDAYPILKVPSEISKEDILMLDTLVENKNAQEIEAYLTAPTGSYRDKLYLFRYLTLLHTMGSHTE